MHELILGGQKSGKSRAAEARALAWQAAGGEALLIATALAGDGEMAERISRHRADRAQRWPALPVVEAPLDLAGALARAAAPGRLVVVDCLTLWLTQRALPLDGPPTDDAALAADAAALVDVLRQAPAPVVLVSNEIGFGVAPLGAEARRVVDALGRLHQAVAAVCARVTLLVAGCEMVVKGGPR